MAKVLNRTELAEFCGVSLVTIDNWVREGCPYVSRPVRRGAGQWEFSPGAVFQWRVDKERKSALGEVAEIDESEARRRKLAAEAGLAELELHLANGAAVKIQDQEKVWVQMVGAARARLLSLPSKLGRLLAIELEASACQSLVESGINEALLELSEFQVEEDQAENAQLSDDAVDARLVQVAQCITRIRNAAASGGAKQLAGIVSECDRARAEIFGLCDEPGGTSKPSGSGKADNSAVGAPAEVNDFRVGGRRKTVKSRGK